MSNHTRPMETQNKRHTICLVVDDFRIKYIKRKIYSTSKPSLRKYKVSANWTGSNISVWHRFQHPQPTRRQDSSHKHDVPQYGVKVQYTKSTDISPAFDALMSQRTLPRSRILLPLWQTQKSKQSSRSRSTATTKQWPHQCLLKYLAQSPLLRRWSRTCSLISQRKRSLPNANHPWRNGPSTTTNTNRHWQHNHGRHRQRRRQTKTIKSHWYVILLDTRSC